MFICSGIGAAPFSSVLKHILFSLKQETSTNNIKYTEFYWVNRRTNSFLWLQTLLVEIQQRYKETNGISMINIFSIAVCEEDDLR